MATTNQPQQAHADRAGQGVPGAAAGDGHQPTAARLTTEQVWHQVAKASFAVLGYVTPSGEPRSSGLVYKTIGRRLYVAVAPESWKAKHVAASGRVAVTVPVRRGGLLSLVAPIPPATISFHGAAIVHPAGSPEARSLLKELASLIPAERQASGSVIEVVPEGEFLTYGLGVPLRKARPGRRAGTRAGDAGGEHAMNASLTDPTIASPDPGPVGIDELELKARIDGMLNRWPAVGLAVGVVRDGSLEFFHGHGVADIASNTPITEDTVFRIASISKTFTAIAVMQLCEQGLLDLDAPANAYLRAFKLLPARAGFRPATARHLLTHTAGLPEVVRPSRTLRYAFGESFKLQERLPTLGEYYRGGLRLVTEPGTTFRYTDHSFATLGQLVEDVSGTPLDRYLRERIFDPLGMADTDLLRSERVRSRLARGYTLGAKGPKAVTDRQWVTAAASSIYSTPRDMARYLAALLGGGTGEHGSVLKPATLAMMFEPQYRSDPRVPGIGLAFSRFNLGGHLAVEHEGILPGFNSDIFLAPDDGVGVMAFTNGARQAMLWLPAEAGRLLGYLLGVPDEAIRTDVPQHPELWGDLCGWYRLPAPLTDTRARSVFGLGAEVFVRRGQLMVRALSPIPAVYNGFVLHPDDDQDPYVFRIDLSQFGIGTARVIFTRDPGTAPTRVQLELYPLALQRQPASKNPRLWAAGALAAGTTAVAIRRRRATRCSNGRAS